jgi:hypothetical protein
MKTLGIVGLILGIISIILAAFLAVFGLWWLALIFGALSRMAAIGWIVMSLAYFGVKIDLIFVQGRIVPCGCFQGIFPNLLVTQSIWIDLVSIVCCAYILVTGNAARTGRKIRNEPVGS